MSNPDCRGKVKNGKVISGKVVLLHSNYRTLEVIGYQEN
jgi:hypothetical protein